MRLGGLCIRLSESRAPTIRFFHQLFENPLSYGTVWITADCDAQSFRECHRFNFTVDFDVSQLFHLGPAAPQVPTIVTVRVVCGVRIHAAEE
jgi:hypothetical protein